VLGDFGPGKSCLDVGAGDAWFAQQLTKSMPDVERVVCWDINYDDSQLADLRAAAPAALELTNTSPRGQFDLLLLLDVVEHVEDDEAFLADLVNVYVRPGGTIVISVPAYNWLFSNHDRFLRHYRRYSPSQCRALMARVGLEPVAQGGLFHALLPVRAAQVLAERARSSSTPEEVAAAGVGRWGGNRLVTKLLANALQAEGAISFMLGRRQRVVPGLSYWAVARRP
jgi:SAM-dependent methyltransferase